MLNMLFALDIDANPWNNFGTRNNIDANNPGWKILLGITQDWFTVCLTIGTIGLLITLMVLGMRLMRTKNSNKRADIKEALTAKIIIAFCLFAITTVIGLTVTIAEALV